MMTISNFMSLPGTFVVLIVVSLSLGYFDARFEAKSASLSQRKKGWHAKCQPLKNEPDLAAYGLFTRRPLSMTIGGVKS
jgi:hypothetical protein